MILFCAYREWALKCCSRFSDGNLIVSTTEDLYKYLSEFSTSIQLIIFVGWSNLISEDVINNFTCLCYHPSDLPCYRGGSPLQHQIIDGIIATKGTLFKMDKGVDSGPIFMKEPLSLDGDMEQILNNLEINASILIERLILEFKKSDSLQFIPQDESLATKFKRRRPEMSEITIDELLNNDSIYLLNKIRALGDPYPNAFIKTRDGKKLLIKKAGVE